MSNTISSVHFQWNYIRSTFIHTTDSANDRRPASACSTQNHPYTFRPHRHLAVETLWIYTTVTQPMNISSVSWTSNALRGEYCSVFHCVYIPGHFCYLLYIRLTLAYPYLFVLDNCVKVNNTQFSRAPASPCPRVSRASSIYC